MPTAERDARERSFDCVAFMREARSGLSEKMNSMTSEDFRHWMRHHEYSDPRLAKLAAHERPARGAAERPKSDGA